MTLALLPTPHHALALLLAGMLTCMHGLALADQVVRRAAAAGASGAVNLGAAPQWRELTPAQRKILQPLAKHWAGMDEVGRDKWVNVADRFDKLSPAEQQRVQERMGQWAKLPPQERGEARLRFRQDLARQAVRKAKPVLLADNVAGPREAGQAYGGKHGPSTNNSAKKSNLVPGASNGATPSPTAVSPTLVKAGPGATTNLVTQRPTPPLHQHSGLPKIAASKGFVDPVTLLPQKGAQGAAMASLPPASSAATEAAHQTRR